MGYYIFSFGVKEKKVLKTFNSKNEDIIKKTEENEHFQNYNEDNDNEIVINFEELKDIDFSDINNLKKNKKNKSELTVRKALSDIVNGEELNKDYGYTYGYALISICATLGKGLPYQQEIKLGYETDYINQFLKEDFGLKNFNFEDYLFSDEKLSSLPIPNIKDWPMLSVIKLEELKELKERLKHIKITDNKITELEESEEEEDEDRFESYEHIRGIIDNIDFCIENELDLFSACH